MAAKKTVCPQCRTDSGIVLLDKNAERAMYKCKKCKPFHIFSVSNCVDSDEPSPFELEVDKDAGTEKPSCKRRVGVIVGVVLVCAAIGLVYYFFRG